MPYEIDLTTSTGASTNHLGGCFAARACRIALPLALAACGPGDGASFGAAADGPFPTAGASAPHLDLGSAYHPFDTAGPADSGGKGDTGGSGRGDPLIAVDVLVIGAGAAGVGAATEAKAKGASVLLVERTDAIGGASIYAGNHWAAGTPWQADKGVVDSPDAALAEWADITGGDADAPVVRSFVEESSSVLEWLAEYGVDWLHSSDIPVDTGTVARMHAYVGQSPVQTVGADLAADTWLGTNVTGLVVDKGTVVGAWVVEKAGVEGWIQASAVVVATGGFARNDAMVAAARPGVDAFVTHYEAHPGMDGNGLTMMQAAGGVLTNMENLGLFAHSVEDGNLGRPEVMVVVSLTSTLVVDARGDRVESESLIGSIATGARYLEEGPFYVLFDDAQWTNAKFQGRGFNYGLDEVTSITGPEYEERHYVASADTMADVAVAAGIDSDGLVATLSTYNLDAAAGVDTVFGKDAAYMQQLTSPPFRVLPLVLGRSKSFGGCSAGVDGAVLDSGGTPIPGLYAAGEATGILGGPWIGWGFNGTITAVWWSGLRAGEAAAAAAGH